MEQTQCWERTADQKSQRPRMRLDPMTGVHNNDDMLAMLVVKSESTSIPYTVPEDRCGDKRVRVEDGTSSKRKRIGKDNPADSQLKVEESNGGTPYLLDLFAIIHYVFELVNFSPMTKEELVRKAYAHVCDIHPDDSGVVSEIECYEKILPEWIWSKKSVLTGELWYSINKDLDVNLVRRRSLYL